MKELKFAESRGSPVFKVKHRQPKSKSVVHLGAKIVEQDVRVRGAEGHAGGNPENNNI